MKAESIIEAVNKSPNLLKLIQTFREKGFLIEMSGMFASATYIINKENLQAEYQKDKSLLNTLALGASLYYDFLAECTGSLVMGGDFIPSYKSHHELREWKKKIKKKFPSDYREISEVSLTIGRYLEYLNMYKIRQNRAFGAA